MASQTLYQIPPTTTAAINKLRLGSSRSSTPQSQVYSINKSSLEVLQTPAETFTNIEELVEELPSNTPRFILLSYPLVTKDGRRSAPFVMIYYLPETATQEARMLYAGAVEIVRAHAGVSKLLEISDEEEFENIQDLF
ncbi:hypothetical protein V1514DRAFT_342347 [Lipomyces japonicus]|uniref:uncharacterized protein n=1 Tax=Lipomyces japonicus TaxID=56871 RepID=UPI0034CF3F90